MHFWRLCTHLLNINTLLSKYRVFLLQDGIFSDSLPDQAQLITLKNHLAAGKSVTIITIKSGHYAEAGREVAKVIKNTVKVEWQIISPKECTRTA